jgi:hypothetical protein
MSISREPQVELRSASGSSLHPPTRRRSLSLVGRARGAAAFPAGRPAPTSFGSADQLPNFNTANWSSR